MSIRVFQINESEWWAGDCDELSILDAFMQSYECTHIEATGNIEVYPRSLSEEELSNTLYEIPDTDGVELKVITFKELLTKLIDSGAQLPCKFASLEW